MGKLDEVALIEGTIRDLEAALANLRGERAALDTRIEEAEERICVWKARLKQHTNQGQGARQNGPRLKRGEALARIDQLFDANQPDDGYSIREIADRTGIAWSSVRNVIKRTDSGYHERSDRWFKNDHLFGEKKNGTQEGAVTK